MNEDTGDTGASLDALDQLRAQMRSHRLLSHDEHLALISRAQDGDPDALHAMVAHNLRLVFSVAKHFTGQGVPLLDLVQEGCLGLIRAVERFDAARGNQFSTFANPAIWQMMYRAVADQSRLIRLPEYMHLRVLQARRDHADRARATGVCEPSGDWRVVSLYQPIDPNDTDGATIGDHMLDSAAIEPDPERIACEEVLLDLLNRARLPGRMLAVLALRYGLAGHQEHTLAEVGRRLKISRERARQLQVCALAKLRLVATHSADRDALLALVA